MIVKKLRADKKWSQEQLAIMSGLSIRTIQRVESGQSASIETLKSLASVFEVNISKLTEEITVIDKTSENWKRQPWLFRFMFFGIRSRRIQLTIELFVFIVALYILFFDPNKELSSVFFIGAYITGWSVRYGDTKNLW